MSASTAPTSELPTRAGTNMTNSSMNSEAGTGDVDPSTTAGLLAERLQAWKHAVGYLEQYMTAIEKVHHHQSKEYERALKTISHPLREGHHFDQSLGGIAGYFENMRSNTQALINTNAETEKSIKGSVLPVLERLHKEIKSKSKEVTSGVEKTAKEVDRARNSTQKHVELLGQHTASFESSGGKLHGADDPYVLRRGVMHRLHKQVMEENNNRNDLIAVQNNFQSFEAHVIETIQQAMEAFTQLAGGQGEKTRALHYDMLGAAQRVPPDFEWKGFASRSGDRLINQNEPPRSVDDITFPNMDHTSTKPLVEGSLQRKSRNKLSWGTSTAYYVVTPSKFLHEFKDSDDTRHDPKPELSIYLPDAVVGSVNGDKFHVKGKDRSKSMSAKLSGSSELHFIAHTPADAQKWYQVLSECAGATGPAAAADITGPAAAADTSAPASPQPDQDDKFASGPAPGSVSRTASGAAAPGSAAATPGVADEHKGQEAGIMGDEPVKSPEAMSPVDTKQ